MNSYRDGIRKEKIRKLEDKERKYIYLISRSFRKSG